MRSLDPSIQVCKFQRAETQKVLITMTEMAPRRGTPTMPSDNPERDQPDAAAGLDAVMLRVDRRLPVSDQVYEALRTAIVRVSLLPGTLISENSIGRQFGVSRTPIRAAIQRLAEDGLIEVFPQQGSFVAPIKLADIHDSHFVRRSLELALLDEVGRIWTRELSDIVRDSIAVHRASVVNGDIEAFYDADEAFHRLFAELARREGVWTVILAARARLMRFLRLFGGPERLPVVVEEHLAIVDALDAGDLPRARAALADHLDKVFQILEQLPERFRTYLAD
jgi:DNA-binding GntR family transcriptional regulator